MSALRNEKGAATKNGAPPTTSGTESVATRADDLLSFLQEHAPSSLTPPKDEPKALPSEHREQAHTDVGVQVFAEDVLAVTVVSPDVPDDRTKSSKRAPRAVKSRPAPCRTLTGRAKELAEEPDILSRFAVDLSLAGVAREERIGKLIYLAVTSRVLPWGRPGERPVSVIVKGTTSTGKSFTTTTVLRFFPDEAYFDLSSMSTRYMLYTEEELRHRFIYVAEAAAIAKDDELLSALRTLLSEGRLIHGTVDDHRKARRIEKDGPTGLLMTTTQAVVDPNRELDTRCLSLTSDDSQDQTRQVFKALAAQEEEARPPVDFESWRELQTWIAEDGEHRVLIPYFDALAELFPINDTRLRRDFVSMLCLIRANAILHQLNRERSDDGRIVATLSDYEAVYNLIGPLVAEGAESGVSQPTRETVEAVSALLAEGAEYVNVKAIQDKVRVGRSATFDRVKRCLEAGYLVNKAATNERGWKVSLGSPLPGDEGFLPSPSEVEAAFVRLSSRGAPDDVIPVSERLSDVSSGRPVRPAVPRPLTEVNRPRPRTGTPAYRDWLRTSYFLGELWPSSPDRQSKYDRQVRLHEAIRKGDVLRKSREAVVSAAA